MAEVDKILVEYSDESSVFQLFRAAVKDLLPLKNLPYYSSTKGNLIEELDIDFQPYAPVHDEPQVLKSPQRQRPTSVAANTPKSPMRTPPPSAPVRTGSPSPLRAITSTSPGKQRFQRENNSFL